MCDQIVNLVPQIQAGTIKAYAVALPTQRSPALPDVPTTKEGGLPEFQVTAWNAIFAPKGTPPDVLAKLSGALRKALADEATRKRLLDLGADLSDTAAADAGGPGQAGARARWRAGTRCSSRSPHPRSDARGRAAWRSGGGASAAAAGGAAVAALVAGAVAHHDRPAGVAGRRVLPGCR